MATSTYNIYLTKREKLHCKTCGKDIPLGHAFVGETEKSRGTCLKCSPFIRYTLLPPGDAAMTRRSKKYSSLCGVLLAWNHRRKRYERRGQYVEAIAIIKAREECEADKATRTIKNKKAATKREEQDKAYISAFGDAIRKRYPNCPKNREIAIAIHACEKHSGRVGRTARAKTFDPSMIDRAVEAHIRHEETNYDNEFGKGKPKHEIRSDLKMEIRQIMIKWKKV